MSKKILALLLVFMLSISLLPVTASAADVVEFDVLRTTNNPGYYFSGAILDMGVELNADDVDKDTFSAKARVKESSGSYQGPPGGSFGWDPEMSDRFLDDNWAKWNILDAYVADKDGNKVDTGSYVKIEIEWETRTQLNAGGTDGERYDVPATRAGWFNSGFRFSTVEVELEQNAPIEGVGTLTFAQRNTLHDPLFEKFNPEVITSMGTTSELTFVKSLYKPEGKYAAGRGNKKPLVIWFQGRDSQYIESANNIGSTLVFNNLLSLADTDFQDAMDGAYILVPQTVGSVNYANNANYITAIERIIKDVIDDPSNFIDTDRIIVGGNSMGGNMVGYLVGSADSTVDYAAAVFCSGPATAAVNAAQAQIAVGRDIAFYSLRNSTDFQGGSGAGTTTYNNLVAADANITQSLYSERYTFDGDHYYGAHDSWNYLYNNVATYDNGNKTIFEWMAAQSKKGDEASYDVLRTSINPGLYFSGAIIDMGVTLNADDVDKDTFSVAAKVTEADGSVQGSFGNFGWDPEKESYALGDNWAKWNILDAYVVDADGNRAESGEYVKIDIEWGTRTEQSGASNANRYDVPATRASWYTISGYHAFASIELDIEQNKAIPGVSKLSYTQNLTKNDPLFDAFDLSLTVPGGGKAPFYTPDNASEDNLRPLLVWFHGTGERYAETTVNDIAVNNAGGNLVGNRALSFADEEFQTIMDGAYVLAPQSTTAGWSANRLNDMEALIKEFVAENYIDPERIYVGGLSMGTGMTTPLIASTTENSIKFAAAMLVSGGNLNADQSATIAAKGFPVYFVGNTSDYAANGQATAYNNLIAAGGEAMIMRYPAGPVFDGDYYYGAHDSWNYVYNNLVEDEDGETIFEWLANQTRREGLRLSTDANLVKKGEYFRVNTFFNKAVNSNTAILNYEYDTSKFDYRNFTPADGVGFVSAENTDTGVKIIVMISDYNTKDYGELLLSAKEDIDLEKADNEISVKADYVVKDGDVKIIRSATASTTFTSSYDKDEYTLIDLSDIIDIFGKNSKDSGWDEYRFYDFNGNGEIDANDISTLASKI